LLALLMLWPVSRRGDPPRQDLKTIAFPAPTPSPSPEPPPPRTAAEQPSLPASAGGKPGPIATPIPILAADPPSARPAAANVERADSAATGSGNGTSGAARNLGGPGLGGGQGGTIIGETSPARWIGGAIRDSDYPRRARIASEQGRVETRIRIDKRGRAADCMIARSSGSAELDRATCRLILRRFRFAPARDKAGQPIEGTVPYDQEWVFRAAGAE
jgi:periplasmic protein TonB